MAIDKEVINLINLWVHTNCQKKCLMYVVGINLVEELVNPKYLGNFL